MATTPLVIRSNRLLNYTFLDAAVAAVAIDAQQVEQFSLPAGFGDLWLCQASIAYSSLSADKVDPTGPRIGSRMRVISSDVTQVVDDIGTAEYYSTGATAARPVLSASWEKLRFVLVRQQELIQIVGTILAGAGATATITLQLRGIRMRQA